MVPYISGIYGAPAATRVLELPSLVENDGYFISCSLMDILGSVYDPGATNSRNPLCWPYHASIEELADLPVGSRNQDWITPPPVHIRGSQCSSSRQGCAEAAVIGDGGPGEGLQNL